MISEDLNQKIAHVAYEAVRAWDSDHGIENIPEWKDASEVVCQTAYNRVRLTLSDPRAGDATFHNERVALMKAQGWASGRGFDKDLKIDPTLVGFHLLEPRLQARERVFRSVVLALSRI